MPPAVRHLARLPWKARATRGPSSPGRAGELLFFASRPELWEPIFDDFFNGICKPFTVEAVCDVLNLLLKVLRTEERNTTKRRTMRASPSP